MAALVTPITTGAAISTSLSHAQPITPRPTRLGPLRAPTGPRRRANRGIAHLDPIRPIPGGSAARLAPGRRRRRSLRQSVIVDADIPRCIGITRWARPPLLLGRQLHIARSLDIPTLSALAIRMSKGSARRLGTIGPARQWHAAPFFRFLRSNNTFKSENRCRGNHNHPRCAWTALRCRLRTLESPRRIGPGHSSIHINRRALSQAS